jgi:hypothetical protein
MKKSVARVRPLKCRNIYNQELQEADHKRNDEERLVASGTVKTASRLH